MTAVDFQPRMTELARTLDAAPAHAAALAQALERDLLAAGSVDPIEFGWARDYHVRALYRAVRPADCVALVEARPPCPMAISAKNAAWIHSVAAEMALRAGQPAKIRGFMTTALDLRITSRDPESCGMAVETGVVLLREAGLSAELDAWIADVEARAAVEEAAIAEALGEALAKVARAAWFPGELPSAARRRGEMALHRAAADGLIDEVRRRLDAGVDLDARHPAWGGLPTPLIAASFGGHREVVALLLARGADPRPRNVQGRTALHQAADQGHAAIVALLCEAGAPLDAVDFHRHTALHVAAWQDHRACVDVLLAAGVDREAQDVNGDTALALAATEPVPEVVRALLAAGARVMAINAYDQTPLIRAAAEGQAATAAVLLDAGADPTHRDHNGRTALDWAQAEGHREVVKLLKRAPQPPRRR